MWHQVMVFALNVGCIAFGVSQSESRNCVPPAVGFFDLLRYILRRGPLLSTPHPGPQLGFRATHKGAVRDGTGARCDHYVGAVGRVYLPSTADPRFPVAIADTTRLHALLESEGNF